MDLVYGGKSLVNLAKTNVLLGKNGCGKSTLLRLIDEQARSDPRTGLVKYISPERGGELNYDGNVETNIVRDPNWLHSNRRNNRSDSFRQTSAIEFRRLETLVLRKIEKDSDTRRDPRFTFDSTIAEINSLLDNVQIGRADDVGFKTRPVSSTEYWPNQQKLSSGESELISLAIEILSFCYQVEQKNDPGKHNLLLLDEPDVHLHPDLQHRLMTLLTNAIRSKAIVVVIATHSTAILAGLSSHSESAVGFMKAGDNLIRFQAITEAARAILPIFGAHPLSNVFNERPVLLVEGEDDVRIWQQAVRSSAGRVSVWPCAAGDVQSLDSYEEVVEAIAGAVYDNAKAYSIRDRDEGVYEIDNKAVIVRMRLACRAAENLLLTDDVLRMLNTDWAKMQAAIEKWLHDNPSHPQAGAMHLFRDSHYDRCKSDLKSLRNILMALAGSNKPWEVAVGQAIANLATGNSVGEKNSLDAYLGSKLILAFFPHRSPTQPPD